MSQVLMDFSVALWCLGWIALLLAFLHGILGQREWVMNALVKGLVLSLLAVLFMRLGGGI